MWPVEARILNVETLIRQCMWEGLFEVYFTLWGFTFLPFYILLALVFPATEFSKLFLESDSVTVTTALSFAISMLCNIVVS